MTFPSVEVAAPCNTTVDVHANHTHISRNNSCLWSHFDTPWLGPLTSAFGFVNCLLNLLSMCVFVRICNTSRRAQLIHYLLFYMTVLEAANMFFYGSKEIFFRLHLFLPHSVRMSSSGVALTKYYFMQTFQWFSTGFNGARNWWLTTIALTRSHSIIQLLTKPYKTVNEGVTKTLRRQVNLIFGAVLLCAGVFSFSVHISALYRPVIVLCAHSPPDGPPYDLVRLYSKVWVNRGLLDLIHESILVIAPLVIMLGCNVVICISLKLLAGSAATDANSQRIFLFTRVTRTVIILVTTFLLLEMPFVILQLLMRQFGDNMCVMMALENSLKLADLLVAVNSSCNIIIYYYWESIFQQHFLAIIHLDRRRSSATALSTRRSRKGDEQSKELNDDHENEF